MQDERKQALQRWVQQKVEQRVKEAPAQQKPATDTAVQALEMVSGDASFRRYFRARTGRHSYIAVDAPPEHENSRRFVAVARLLAKARVNVPAVEAVDFEQGFMLLTDLGDDLYLDHLLRFQQQGDIGDIGDSADALYQDAIHALVMIQQGADKEQLDPYDRHLLHREMALFDTWFCSDLLALELKESETALIQRAYRLLEDTALAQPQLVVHRDYHSRNLLVLDREGFADHPGPGIIDFQDAVRGPYTYDLVSLLRDCYICWPEARISQWCQDYLRQAEDAGIVAGITAAGFQRDFDFMGLQRHLKVMGIFARLAIRDKKTRYLADIPLVIRYFLEVASRYEELADLTDWFREAVLPVAASHPELAEGVKSLET